MSPATRLVPLAVEPKSRPCVICQDWGTVPDPERRGQYKTCPEQCAAARRAQAGSGR
ncbi:hypothetical protein Kpho02_72960 [Kitasatospora phosalacinea]|uniref:Uncharacterized protein n=1 Tax=Kitasatospora phosalacinea TaxID=2065 RepID=A0A9W6QF63_9ACTN|nr:hypothetical protein [Kitasatospora phosalacinea]GLW74999.1 hypothetical protein Kpho02_72960 [Kitasatospora phosalacinea]